MVLANIFEGAALFVGGAVVCFALLWWRERSLQKARLLQTQALLDKARADAEIVKRDAAAAASQEALKLREQIEQSFADRRAERAESERRLGEREALINSQLQQMMEAERALKEQKQALGTQMATVEAGAREVAELKAQAREQLQKISGLTRAEAREGLLKAVEQEAVNEASNLSRRILDEAKARAEEKARQIISVAIQRYASDHTFENSTSTITLPSDEIKGRIIGREGRNIRAFEAAAGVTILVDDTPGAVVISGFDPVRREIAREAMSRLIQDGRIHPTRIEEVVAAVTKEMEETVVRLGDEAVTKAGLPPMHPEIVKLLGRLHFRHSYAQNILDHSVEVAHLMGLMAAELGMDIATAKRAGLLHDIGKAVNHEIEGPHAVVGAEFIKRFGESEAVVNGVASHHNDVPPVGPLGVLVSAADAISASRPGARSETMSTYLKRIEDLEKIASTMPGVDKAFAVQAGRELRVFVQPDEVDDQEAFALARNIASKIQDELQYPGQIKVTVIRETRCVEVAK
ncbi:MAG TPA: ribonuclease Y [Candidatus Polarisedimenticolia bacterium]|nr:ribonuclease Y [Candidatus Polarisedimenticolia bacterium]